MLDSLRCIQGRSGPYVLTAWVLWYTSVIPVLRRLRQEDLEFEAG
jgi:hypothetical protein